MATFLNSRRALLIFVALDVIVFGLLVHYLLSGAFANFLADALYAVMIYLLIAVIWPKAKHLLVAACALGFSAGVELFQLTPLPAQLSEAFPPARLVLGTTFSAIDLLAYAVGVVVVLAVDFVITERLRQWRISRSE